MLIGKGVATSSSFVNYQLNSTAEKDDNSASNVNDAIRGKTIGERNKDAMDSLQESVFNTDAYKVDISERVKNWMTYVSGSTAQISSSINAGWTREDELDALEKSIGRFQKMNDSYRMTGSPVDPQEERKRMADISARFASGNMLDVSSTADESGISIVRQDFSQVLKTPTGLENNSVSQTVYTPVTEIRTKHYRWTEETGIEETLSKEEEFVAARAELRLDLENTVTQSIEAILTPYKSYEEAYDALYGRQGVAVWSSLNEENMSRTEQLRPIQGAFGALANHLNNYLEEFGSDDSFFSTLDSALDGLLDKYGENDIVNQIRRMVATSRSGNTINTATEQFEKEVTDATVATYIGVAEQQDNIQEKKTKDDSQEQKQGLTFLDMQRREAEEGGRLMDKLLGKESESKIESAGDVLKKRNPDGKDTEFTDKLRRVGEKEDSPQPFTFETAGDKGQSTLQPKDGVERLTAIHDAWLSVSDELMDGFAEEKQRYFENAVNQKGIDILI